MKFATTVLLMMTMVFSSMLMAEDQVILPVISKPTVLQEGTQRELTPAQIEELLPWAKNSKVFLQDLLDGLQGISSADKVDRMVDGFKMVVGESAPKNSELLMRYTLNRALVVNDLLSSEMSDSEVGTVDAKIRVLTFSLKMAIKYYDADIKTLSKKSTTNFAEFGVDYFKFLSELNKSIFDASAQYAIQKTALEWLQWDLYRDLNNASYAPQIVKINNNLKVLPANKKITDTQAITYIRQMKLIAKSLNLKIVESPANQVSNSNSSISKNIEISSSSSSGESEWTKLKNLKNNSSYKACYDLKTISLTDDGAMTFCRKEVEVNNFDFTSSNFKACYNLNSISYTATVSVDNCVNSISVDRFDYKDTGFKKCYDYRSISWSNAVSINKCVNDIKNNVDYLNPELTACYNEVGKKYSSDASLEKCLIMTKRN